MFAVLPEDGRGWIACQAGALRAVRFQAEPGNELIAARLIPCCATRFESVLRLDDRAGHRA